MRVLLFCIIYCFSAIFSAEICDIKKCPNYSLWVHYRELNCTPVYDLNSEDVKCCPIAYDCEILKTIRENPKKCYLNGNEYNIQNILVNELSCSFDCRCTESENNNTFAELNCPIVDCPEEKVGLQPNFGCYFAYDFQHCCSTGQICPKKKRNPRKFCKVQDKTYFHGQYMHILSQKCSQCLCIDGKSECKRIGCNVERNYATRFATGSGIIYYGRESCCPYDIISPSSNDKILSKALAIKDPSKPQCKFGNLLANIGDAVITSRTTANMTCSCSTPPIITCIQDSYFEAYKI